jgi:hypothetical protein
MVTVPWHYAHTEVLLRIEKDSANTTFVFQVLACFTLFPFLCYGRRREPLRPSLQGDYYSSRFLPRPVLVLCLLELKHAALPF